MHLAKAFANAALASAISLAVVAAPIGEDWSTATDRIAASDPRPTHRHAQEDSPITKLFNRAAKVRGLPTTTTSQTVVVTVVEQPMVTVYKQRPQKKKHLHTKHGVEDATVVTVVEQPIVTVYKQRPQEKKHHQNKQEHADGDGPDAKRDATIDLDFVTLLTVTASAAGTTTVFVNDTPPPAQKGPFISTLPMPSQALTDTRTLNSVDIAQTAVAVSVTPSSVTASGDDMESTPTASPITLTNPIYPYNTVVRNASETTSIANNTATDTHSYIDISTFSATGISTHTASINATLDPSSSAWISSLLTATGSPSTKTPASYTADTGGFTGAVTSTVGSNSSRSVEMSGYHLPALMVAAMAACLGMALLL